MPGLESKQARNHAEKDISQERKVLAALPSDIQTEIHKLANQVSKKGLSKSIVADKYFIAVADISSERAKRDYPIPTPIGKSKATFRMVGEVKDGRFVEAAGTSYSNIQPEGLDHLYDSQTQSSHALPSMLMSPENRARGNTGIEKTSFVNQTYDRGSEEAIFKMAVKLAEPVIAVVEVLE